MEELISSRQSNKRFVFFLIEHTEGDLPMPGSFPASSVHKLDHVVINTNDPEGFIQVYEKTYE